MVSNPIEKKQDANPDRLVLTDTNDGQFFSGAPPFLAILLLGFIGTFAAGFLTYRHVLLASQAGAVDEWPEGLYEAEMRVAAFHNGFFTALCNRVGKEPKLEFSGESFVCNPDGTVIARAGKSTEEVLYCNLDLNLIPSSHARTLFLPNRRAELYTAWLK